MLFRHGAPECSIAGIVIATSAIVVMPKAAQCGDESK
jgi:hypothetical protein